MFGGKELGPWQTVEWQGLAKSIDKEDRGG